MESRGVVFTSSPSPPLADALQWLSSRLDSFTQLLPKAGQRRGWVSCSRSATLEGSCLRGWQEPLSDREKTHLPIRNMVPWML